VNNSSLLTKHLQMLGASLRLRGRAQSDPAARIPHILVVGLLAFLIIENAIVIQFISPKFGSGIVAPLNLLVASALGQQSLAGLPEELRRELMKAVISLDTDCIAALIGRVSEQGGVLGKALECQAGRFAYTEILNALEDDGCYERKVDARQV
jgi:hypothetical protein